MRSPRGRLLGIVITVVALIAGGAAGAGPVSATPSTTTFLQAVGDVGDPVVGPTEYLFTPPDTTIRLAGGGGDWQDFLVEQPSAGHYWLLTFAAYYGQDFVAGKTYTDVGWSPDETHGALRLQADQRDCSTSRGAFTLLQFARDPGGAITQFAATFELRCQVPGPASHGTLYYNATLPYEDGASLELAGLDREPAGEPVTLTGSLSDGTAGIAGATLSVRRTDQSGTTDLADVSADADGSFAVHDTMATTTATYVVVFAGNDSVQGLMATHVVVEGVYLSTLSAAAPATAARGSTYTLTGRLVSGGAALEGATLTATRTDLAGERVLHVTTGEDGTYSLPDRPAIGGTVTWKVAWAGDTTHARATAKAVVNVPRSATALTITTDRTIYAYKAVATVKVHLGTTYNSRTVSVYARPLGTSAAAPGKLLITGRVGSTGNLVVHYTITRRTTFTAVFAGDYRYKPAQVTASPNVRTVVTLTMSGFSSYSNGYYRYRAGSSGTNAKMTVVDTPPRPYGCVRMTAQRLVHGRWTTVAAASCVELNSSSKQYLVFVSNRTRGSKFRVQASVGSNVYSTSGTSPWRYFTFA